MKLFTSFVFVLIIFLVQDATARSDPFYPFRLNGIIPLQRRMLQYNYPTQLPLLVPSHSPIRNQVPPYNQGYFLPEYPQRLPNAHRYPPRQYQRQNAAYTDGQMTAAYQYGSQYLRNQESDAASVVHNFNRVSGHKGDGNSHQRNISVGIKSSSIGNPFASDRAVRYGSVSEVSGHIGNGNGMQEGITIG